MNHKEIYSKLSEIFNEVFDLDNFEVTPETSAADIDEWDSLANIQLVVAIQKAFNVKISSAEILSWNNVGDMVNSLLAK